MMMKKKKTASKLMILRTILLHGSGATDARHLNTKKKFGSNDVATTTIVYKTHSCYKGASAFA